jgi:flagellar protein FliT
MEQQLLSVYQQIDRLSNQMVTLAQSGDWDALNDVSERYIKTVENTADLTAVSGVSMVFQAILRDKLQLILSNETECKRLVQLRMNELKELIVQSTQQNNINTTYGQYDSKAYG